MTILDSAENLYKNQIVSVEKGNDNKRIIDVYNKIQLICVCFIRYFLVWS